MFSPCPASDFFLKRSRQENLPPDDVAPTGCPRSCPVSGGRARFAVPGSWALSQPSRLACLETRHLPGNVIKGGDPYGRVIRLSFSRRHGQCVPPPLCHAEAGGGAGSAKQDVLPSAVTARTPCRRDPSRRGLTKGAAGHDIGAPFSLVPFSWVRKRKEPACRRNKKLSNGELRRK
jgi:hypothetical protein